MTLAFSLRLEADEPLHVTVLGEWRKPRIVGPLYEYISTNGMAMEYRCPGSPWQQL